MITIQEALKQLYYSLGGNADNVRETDDPIDVINATSGLNLGTAINAKGIEIVTVTKADDTYVADHDLSDVIALVSDGKPVLVHVVADKYWAIINQYGTSTVNWRVLSVPLMGDVVAYNYVWQSSGITKVGKTLALKT